MSSASVFRTPGAIEHHGKGDDFFLLGGHVQLDAVRGDLLLHVLPPLIHVRATAPQAPPLRWLLDQLVRERQDNLPARASRRRSSRTSCSCRCCVLISPRAARPTRDGSAR